MNATKLLKALALSFSLFSTGQAIAETEKDHYLGLVSRNYNWNEQAELAEQNIITYTFDVSCMFKGKTGFSRVQQNAVVYAFKQIHNITGINFKQVSVDCEKLADISFSNENISRADVVGTSPAYRVFSSKTKKFSGLSVFISVDPFDFKYMKNPIPGTEGYEVLLHEIGHAMGLKHPHDGQIQLNKSFDTTSRTVMSYNQVQGQYNRIYPLLDRQALQFIYGRDGLGGKGYSLPH